MGLESIPENVYMRTCCILYSVRYNMLYLPDWQGFDLENHSSWLKGYLFYYFIKHNETKLNKHGLRVFYSERIVL